MTETWITVCVDRVLYVNRGRDVIFCTDQDFKHGAELVLKLSPDQKRQLLHELKSSQ